jgi:hypothetical protein
LVKHAGLSALSGDIHARMTRLIDAARDADLFILEHGELESFDRSIGLHGPAWVSRAIEVGAHKGAMAQEFIGRIAQSFD